MGRAKQISQGDLLDAAMRVIIRDGLPKLTLEATAEEAGVSKGGVLYSFRSKDDLLSALIRRCVENMDRDIKESCDNDSQSRGRWMRGYLAAAQKSKQESVGELERLHAALLAAIALNPSLLSCVRDFADRWYQSALEDGVDPTEHFITMLAIDGLTFNRMLGSEPPAEIIDSIYERLRERTATAAKVKR